MCYYIDWDALLFYSVIHALLHEWNCTHSQAVTKGLSQTAKKTSNRNCRSEWPKSRGKCIYYEKYTILIQKFYTFITNFINSGPRRHKVVEKDRGLNWRGGGRDGNKVSLQVYASHQHVLHRPLAIVLVKYWKVAPWNAKKSLNNCQK